MSAEFAAQALIIAKPYEHLTAFAAAFENALGVVIQIIVIVDRRNDRNEEGAIGLVTHRVKVAKSIEREIHLVYWVAVLPLILEHVAEDQLAQQFSFFAAGEF